MPKQVQNQKEDAVFSILLLRDGGISERSTSRRHCRSAHVFKSDTKPGAGFQRHEKSHALRVSCHDHVQSYIATICIEPQGVWIIYTFLCHYSREKGLGKKRSWTWNWTGMDWPGLDYGIGTKSTRLSLQLVFFLLFGVKKLPTWLL